MLFSLSLVASRTRTLTATTQTKPTSNRITILSPEKIHRLNAKISDQKKTAKLNNNNNNKPMATCATTATTSTSPSSSANIPPQSIVNRNSNNDHSDKQKRNPLSRSQFFTRC